MPIRDQVIVELQAKVDRYNRNVTDAQRRFTGSMGRIERSAVRAENRVSLAASRMGGALLAAFAGVASVRGAQRLVDASIRVENALKVAGLAGNELQSVYERLFASAQKNFAPIETLAGLYSRAALAATELGASQEDLLGFIDNVGVALRVQGTSSEQARGALIQLSQAIGAGTVRAEEFNAILEGALPIAQAAAAGLEEAGGSVAKLRTLIIDGTVSSEAFFRAFEAGAPLLEEKVASAEVTVSQSLVRLENVLIRVAGDFDEATGASEATAVALNRVADAAETMGDVLVRVANGPVGTLIGRLGELDARARSVFGFLSSLSLNDEIFGALGNFLAPEEQLTEQAIKDFATRNGIGPNTTKLDRLVTVDNAPEINPVSLSDYPIGGGGGGGSGKGGSGGGGGGGGRSNPFEREVRQIRERTEALRAETAAMAEINPLIDDYGFTLEKAAHTQELLSAAERAGIEITPELREKIDTLATSYAAASAEAERLEESQDKVRERAEEFRDLGKDLVGGFVEDLRSGTSAAEALENALAKVADKIIEITLNSAFSGGIGGGLLGGAIIPGILHEGGVAGRDGYGSGRAVSSSAFAGAQRFHRGGMAGLSPGEVPAILQRGELVIPRNRVQQMGGTTVVINAPINAPGADPAQLARVQKSVEQLERNVPKMVDKRTDTRNTRGTRA